MFPIRVQPFPHVIPFAALLLTVLSLTVLPLLALIPVLPVPNALFPMTLLAPSVAIPIMGPLTVLFAITPLARIAGAATVTFTVFRVTTDFPTAMWLPSSTLLSTTVTSLKVALPMPGSATT